MINKYKKILISIFHWLQQISPSKFIHKHEGRSRGAPWGLRTRPSPTDDSRPPPSPSAPPAPPLDPPLCVCGGWLGHDWRFYVRTTSSSCKTKDTARISALPSSSDWVTDAPPVSYFMYQNYAPWRGFWYHTQSPQDWIVSFSDLNSRPWSLSLVFCLVLPCPK